MSFESKSSEFLNSTMTSLSAFINDTQACNQCQFKSLFYKSELANISKCKCSTPKISRKFKNNSSNKIKSTKNRIKKSFKKNVIKQTGLNIRRDLIKSSKISSLNYYTDNSLIYNDMYNSEFSQFGQLKVWYI